MIDSFRKILAISPHTDDVELACGASLARLIHEGAEVHYVALSDCRDTLQGYFDEDALERECKKAVIELGINRENCHVFHFSNKLFKNEARQIYETLESWKERLQPDLVLVPSLADVHQDHAATTQQALTLFRSSASMLGYEQAWNSIDFAPNFFIKVSHEDIRKKTKALQCYKTQVQFKRRYMDKDLIISQARARGIQVDAEFAEAFEVIKWIA